MRKAQGKTILLRGIFGSCMIVFFISGRMLTAELRQASRQQEVFDELKGRFVQDTSGQDEAGNGLKEEELFLSRGWKTKGEQTFTKRFSVYRSLKEENPDMAGWVRIEGTKMDYPVMYSPGRPDYYLRRDFYGRESTYGTPYLMEPCRYESPRTNLLISGHHMKNGAMFAVLQDYSNKEFFEEHPFVQFDTTEEAGTYEVAAVFKISASGEQESWQNLLFPEKRGDFEKAWDEVKNCCFYDTGVELFREDELLALMTCEYSQEDGRLFLIARRLL